ncbi:unnamed protein product [Ectocarpus sp. 12 AP-2014]
MLLVGGHVVLLAPRTRRACVDGKHSRLGWRAWILRESIWCGSAVVVLFRPEHLVW